MISPLPFVGLLKDLLMDLKNVGGISLVLSDVLTGALLGSFIETFLKGAYCDAQAHYCITELHKPEQGDAEVDLIDFKRQIMYEMSISDKSISATHFHVFQEYDYFTKILIGKKKTKIVLTDDEQGIYRVPYPIFVFWLNSVYYTELRDLIN